MNKMWSRNHRLCFMTTRMNAAWIKDIAREHGWTASTLLHHLTNMGLEQIAGLNGPESRVQALSRNLGPTALELLRKDVEKGLGTLPDNDVPW